MQWALDLHDMVLALCVYIQWLPAFRSLHVELIRLSHNALLFLSVLLV